MKLFRRKNFGRMLKGCSWLSLPLALTFSIVFEGCAFPTRGSPGFFEVTATEDESDRNPGDGLCRSRLPGGACTLRAAVEESNAQPGENTIQLDDIEYALTLSSHLLVNDDLQIEGTKSRLQITTIHRASGAGRIFAIESAAVAITDAVISGGVDVANGGGIILRDGSVVSLQRVTVSGNEAYTAAGGIDVHNSTLTLIDTEVVANHATGAFAGGMRINEGAAAIVDRSTFTLNSSNRCGAIYNFGTLRLTNSTISGNSATTPGRGTGGVINIGSAHLNNVTIYNNTSSAPSSEPESSGGLRAVGRTTMSNTIVAGNRLGGTANDCRGEVVSYGYNLMQETGTCSFTDITTGNIHGRDPILSPLRLSSGSLTRVHRPEAASPVINAGHPQVGPGVPALGRCEARDQAGHRRQLTGPGERCDIGSLEY